jgi:hypothetical protein
MGTKYYYSDAESARRKNHHYRITPVAVGSIAECNVRADGAPHEHKREIARNQRRELLRQDKLARAAL